MDKMLSYENTMGNLKDDAKKMDPLFPRLHISDADKGCSRISSRNKMALLQPLSTSGVVPAYHDASYKQSVFSSFGSSCGATRLATRLDSYRSSGINLNISLTTVKQTIETTNCQTMCDTGHLKRGDYRLFKPQDLKTTRNTSIKKLEDEEEDDYLIPSLSFGNTNRGKVATTSTNYHIKQENKLINTTMIKDITKEHMSSWSERIRGAELSPSNPSNPIMTSIVMDEPVILQDSNIRLPLKRKNSQEIQGFEDGMSLWPFLGDKRKTDRGVNEVLPPIDNGSSLITPEEVSHLIGHEQYCKARRTIVQQQKVFQSQLFELHRLIKVQKHLAESPHFTLEDRGYGPKNMPSESIFSIDNTVKRPFHTNNNDADRQYNPSLIDLPQPSTVNGGKQPPWCLLPPPGNQWLVPMRSPSEGLVYKPYTGPCPPHAGLMAPLYGMSLTPSNRDYININSPYPQGIDMFPTNPLFTSCGLPAITKGVFNPTMEEDMKYIKPVKTLCNTILTPEKRAVQNLQENKESDMQGTSKGGDELPLFPITPMVEDTDRCIGKNGCDERIKVIKVVPHNPKLASESAARIFQFIQEERKQNE